MAHADFLRDGIRRAALFVFLLLSITVCSDSGVETEDIAEIVITPATTTLTAVGTTQQFTATARDSQGNTIGQVTFTWTSANTGVATVNNSGLVTARGGGETQITARASGVSGSATVTVSQTADAVVVTPETATIDAGQSQAFTAAVQDANGNAIAGATVNWSSSDEAVATIDPTGTATGQASGTATLTAVSDGVSGTATLTVQAPIASVDVAPAAVDLTALGATAGLTATVTDEEGNTRDDVTVQWTSSEEAIVTVDQNGTVTAQGTGSATVTASVGDVSGTATVNVTQEVATVLVTPETASVEVGSTQQFSAEAQDANGFTIPDAAFAWSSSDEAVATVDGTGLATGQAEGNATIMAESEGVAGTATLTVTVAIASVDVTPATSDLASIGATVQLTATVTDTQGNNVDDATVVWSSSDEAVATVDETGLVTAQGNGSATITATAGDVSGDATVDVSQAVNTVVVSPADAEVAVGETQQFTAEAQDANGNAISDATFNWTSSDEAVATVDGSGLATGQSAGTATVTATAEGVNGTAELTVTAQPTLSLVSGDGQADGRTEEDFSDPLVVEITDANGDPVSDRTVNWTVVGGEGELSASSTTTDSQGRASVTVTAGINTGEIMVEATADDTDGGPITFNLDVTTLVVEIRDNAFVDNQGRTNTNFEVTIRQGDTIEWMYVDDGSTIHTVTSSDEPDGGASFDSGNMTPGESFQFTPGTTGTWTFFCQIHPNIMLDATFTVNN